MTGRAQRVHDRGAFVLANARRADRRKARADAHEHVRVIDRRAVRIEGFECDDLVVEPLREVAKHVQIGARRNTRVRDAPGTIEHQAAGTFEELALLLVLRQVDQLRHPKAVTCAQLVEQLRPPLQPPILGKHRIQHDRAVGMEADPVVRKDRIRRMRVGSVFEHVHVDAGLAQASRQGVELAQRGCLDLVAARRTK